MKLDYKKSILVLLNIILITILYLSWNIYASSYESLPWYEPSGMQFIILYIVYTPVLLVLTIALYILGKYREISIYNKIIPILSAIIIIIPDWLKILTKPYYDVSVIGVIFIFFMIYILYSLVVGLKTQDEKNN